MSEIIRSFFFFTQEQNCFEETSLRSQIWADVSCTLNFPNNNPWVWLLLIYLTVFLPTDRKRYFEAQTTALEVLRAIICLMQTGILWWDGLGFLFLFLFLFLFSSTKEMASPKRSLLTQIRIDICRTLYFDAREILNSERHLLPSKRNWNQQLHHLQSLPSFAFSRYSKMSK